MLSTTIQKLVNFLEKALLDLNSNSSQDFIESTAILIHEGMSAPHRRFHTTEHVFQVIDPKGDPILILSALFHDLVYYNVDGCFTSRVQEILNPYISIELEQIFIRRRGPPQDPILPLVLNVFGFNYGQLLNPYSGLNEFLSAVVFTKLLYEKLNVRDIIRVICCIEASQPFRKPDEQGKTCFNFLEERVEKLNRTRGLGLIENEIIEIVKASVRFANLDVSNFASEDTAEFLDNTWKLLPEQNPQLIGNKVYTVKNYRVALQKMESFFSKINVDVIFHSYRNEPSDEVFFKMQAQANVNANLAKCYLSGRLLSTTILEALCMVTGGDAPVVMLMGNNSKGNVESKYEFNDLINKIPIERAKDADERILELLEFEADVVSILDFRKTPLTAFVYKCIGHAKMMEYLDLAKEYFEGRITAEEFLKKFDPFVVTSIAGACAEMISTRRDRFLKWTQVSVVKRLA